MYSYEIFLILEIRRQIAIMLEERMQYTQCEFFFSYRMSKFNSSFRLGSDDAGTCLILDFIDSGSRHQEPRNLLPSTQHMQLRVLIHPYTAFPLHILTMHMLGTLAAVLLFTASLSQAAVIPQNLEAQLQLLHEIHNNSVLQSPIPTGAILTHCTVPGTIALTFDDGPFIYTPQILDILSAHGARSTFFLNGVNKGSIDGFPELVVRTLAEGHQLGSHSYAVHLADIPSPNTSTYTDWTRLLN